MEAQVPRDLPSEARLVSCWSKYVPWVLESALTTVVSLEKVDMTIVKMVNREAQERSSPPGGSGSGLCSALVLRVRHFAVSCESRLRKACIVQHSTWLAAVVIQVIGSYGQRGLQKCRSRALKAQNGSQDACLQWVHASPLRPGSLGTS